MPEIRQLFESAGPRRGLAISTAVEAHSGLELLRAKSFDVIVLDVRLPGLSGLDALRLLRQQHNWTPVIIFTAFPEIDSALESGRLGAIKYVPKRGGLAPIMSAIQECVRRREQSAEQDSCFSSPASVWNRAKETLEVWRQDESTLSVRALIDLFVDASLDVHRTTVPQLALLSRVVRRLLREPLRCREPIEEALAILAHARAIDQPEADPVAVRLLPRLSRPRDLRQGAFSRELGIDTATVSRWLRRALGTGFHQLRSAALMRPAVAPIARGVEPIGNIAIDCGFETEYGLRAFHRTWKCVTGLTASSFRDTARSHDTRANRGQ